MVMLTGEGGSRALEEVHGERLRQWPYGLDMVEILFEVEVDTLQLEGAHMYEDLIRAMTIASLA